jgi:hypothetical protein
MSIANSKVIPGYSQHEASDLGRVRRITEDGYEILPQFVRGRYPHVRIWCPAKNRVIVRRVHRLVILTFIGPRPSPGMVCRHLDGSTTNNRADNLEWGTRAENHQDAVRHGTANCLRRGGRHPSAKLSDDEYFDLLNRARAGENRSALARQFGITTRYVYRIVQGTGRGATTPEGPIHFDNSPAPALAV